MQPSDSPFSCATFGELLQHRAAQQSDERLYSFLRDDGAQDHLSYAQLLARAQNIAAHLLATNSPANARVLLLLPPGLDLIAGFFGCLLAGFIAVPLPPPHPARLQRQKDRLLSVAQDAQPSLILCDVATQIALQPIRDEIDIAAKSKLLWMYCDEMNANEIAPEISGQKITGQTTAFLQYTSGSTARPKGVLVSHQNLLHNCALIYRAFAHSPKSRGVIWLPPYHDMGLIGGVLQPLYGGFAVSLFSPSSFLMKPLRWLQTISQTRATTSGAPNFAYELCAHKITEAQKQNLDLSSWQVAFIGAEPVRQETLHRFANAFESCGFRREAFLPCYGLAEATLLVSGEKKNPIPQTATKNNQRFVSCGLAASDLDVRIVDSTRSTPDADTDGEVLADGEIGEIFVAGKSVAAGYWNREPETAQTFNARLPEMESQSFLRTGDLGFFQDGELFICGREKDLILIAGRNHFPEDIEATLAAADSSVRAGVAFSVEIQGVKIQGEENLLEEKLVAFVEIDRLSFLDDAQKTALTARFQSEIASRHDLRAHAVLLYRVGALPRTTSGKIQRARCRAEYSATGGIGD